MSGTVMEKCWKEHQSAHYEAVVKWDNPVATLRVQIKRDTYDYQSYARIHKWDGDKWQFITAIPYPLMESEAFAYDEPKEADFQADFLRLLSEANAILT